MSDGVLFVDIFSPEQIIAFRGQVLDHLQQMDEDAWLSFRHHDALMEDRWVTADLSSDAVLALTREDLVLRYVSSSNVPAEQLPLLDRRWISVGMIEDQPIWYSRRCGIYFWAVAQDAPHTLDLWLSFPALPRGW